MLMMMMRTMPRRRLEKDMEAQGRSSTTHAASCSHSSSRMHHTKYGESSRGVLSVLGLQQTTTEVDVKAEGRRSSSSSSSVLRTILMRRRRTMLRRWLETDMEAESNRSA